MTGHSHVSLFPGSLSSIPGSEGVSGGVLEDVFGLGEVTGGAFAGVRNNCSAAYLSLIHILLGDESYDNLFALLEKGGFFKPLFKDELLQLLDRIYS